MNAGEKKTVEQLYKKNLLQYRIGSFLPCVYRVMDACVNIGEHKISMRVARGNTLASWLLSKLSKCIHNSIICTPKIMYQFFIITWRLVTTWALKHVLFLIQIDYNWRLWWKKGGSDFWLKLNFAKTAPIGFFCFAFDKKMPLGKSTFFAYVISRKRSNV